RVARAAEKHRRVNQGRFDAAAFARALEETKTYDEAAAMIKVLENELFERVQKFNLGLDGSRENQDTIVRLEKQIVTLKRKQVTLLSAENAKRQAELSETRGKEIDEIVNDALEDSRERKFAREYDNASAEEKIRMAQERLAQANAASTTALGTLNAMQSDPNVSDEEFNKVKQNLVEANAEIAAFENLLHRAQKEYEAELNARQKEREAKEKAQAKAEWERALGGAYRSNGNSLARNGLMMSSVAPRGIDITAKNTEIIADIAREILRKVDRGTVARAG
ncbi:MAG: hypothetical protein IJW39_04250, partial [Opitutales bacterium]|nr:hypothetical protein [Opitutales bacterium]